MLSCEACNGSIPPNAILEGMAFCPHCKHVFAASAPVAAASSPPLPVVEEVTFDLDLSERVMAGMPKPPSSVLVSSNMDGITLTLPWKREATLPGGNLVFLGLLVLPAVFFTLQGDTGRSELATFVLFEVAVLYAWLITLLNKTVVRLNARGISFQHGPMPTWNRDLRLPWGKVRRLNIEESIRTTRNGGQIKTYNLMNGTSEALTKGWHRRDTLEYLLSLIGHTVNAADLERSTL